ncbi:MAG: hypothetical protein AAGB14_04610 [Verrucomicrobiota bacterium]
MKRTLVHGLAGVLLVAATMAIWHWRFVADPGVLPDTRLSNPLVNWSSLSHEQHEVVDRGGSPILKLTRTDPAGKPGGVRLWFGPLKNVRYIHVRCESRWQDVVPGSHSWHIARFTAHMKTQDGKSGHPPGSHLFGGTGDSDWKANEAVYRLTSDMADFGFAIAMLGKTGTLEVRELSITAVRQRPWVPYAATLVVIGWLGLAFSLIRNQGDRPALWRSLAAAASLVAFCWFFVFPQTRSMYYPLPTTFDTGQAPAVFSPVETANPPAPAPEAIETSSLPDRASPPRDSGELHRIFREIDKRFGPVHIVLFASFTLGFFALTGNASQWRLPLAIAVLAELVPQLTDRHGGWDDWTDLVANLIGVGIALLAWRWFSQRKLPTESHQQS